MPGNFSSRPETFKLSGTLGGCDQHTAVGIDAGQRSTVRVIVEGAVGVAILDPGALRFEQLHLARGRRLGCEGFVGFVELDILALGFSIDAFNSGCGVKAVRGNGVDLDRLIEDVL